MKPYANLGRSLRRRAGLATLALAALPFVAGGEAAIAGTAPLPANGEMGFVVTAFAPAIYQSKDDCPDGPANTVRESYLQSLPPTERTRLEDPANAQELSKRWQSYALGPNNTNICSNPELFDRPIQRVLQGKVALGLNLDGDHGNGSSNPDTCPHEKFTSPTGEPGIDNQVYRAMGCSSNYRGVDGTSGDIVKGFNMLLASGEQSKVLLLRGVHNLEHQDDVEVILASTSDRPILDANHNFIVNASFTVSANPRWRNVLHGHIEQGVLTTDPVDIRLSLRVGHGGIRGQKAEWDLRKARLRLTFEPDGSVKGLVGAYQPIGNVIEHTTLGGIGAATVAGIDCAAQYATLKKLADGVRDPTTGQCTADSTALDFAAVPAFVFDRPPGGASAETAEAK
jgi:hypothetical protein